MSNPKTIQRRVSQALTRAGFPKCHRVREGFYRGRPRWGWRPEICPGFIAERKGYGIDTRVEVSAVEGTLPGSFFARTGTRDVRDGYGNVIRVVSFAEHISPVLDAYAEALVEAGFSVFRPPEGLTLSVYDTSFPPMNQ